MGLSDRTAIEFFNGGHMIHGAGAVEFLRRFRLYGRTDDAPGLGRLRGERQISPRPTVAPGESALHQGVASAGLAGSRRLTAPDA
jgi:hypothetical protein